jgi:hypothetical protein
VSQVFVDVGMSLDGYIAGPNGRPGNPLGDGGTRIHEWVYALRGFRNLWGCPVARPVRMTISSAPRSPGQVPM